MLADVGAHQRSELRDSRNPVPIVQDGVLQPARELAAPASDLAQGRYPARNLPTVGGRRLVPRQQPGLVFLDHLLIPNLFLLLQASVEQQKQIVHEHQEFVLNLGRCRAGTPGFVLSQKVLADVEELLDVPAQAIELSDDSGSQVKLSGQEIEFLAALRVLVQDTPELPGGVEPNALVRQHPVVAPIGPVPVQRSGLDHGQVGLHAGALPGGEDGVEVLEDYRGVGVPAGHRALLLRLLAPDSKRASAQRQGAFYGWDPQIELPDVYRALDHMAAFSVELQQHLDGKVQELIGRDLKYAFYDVTNYFFEIDFPDEDGDRQRGVSKEHRVDPIVQMGLFIDQNGLPVSMSLFPGNTSDTLTLQPVMLDVKKAYQLQRLVVVADKGLNSSKNIDFICNNQDGYVVSQILRGKKGKRYHESLFDEADYVWNPEKTYKYKLFTEEYVGKDKKGQNEIRQRQVLIYWNKAEADMSLSLIHISEPTRPY